MFDRRVPPHLLSFPFLFFSSLLLLLPPSLLFFLPPGKDLPLPHASRLGGGGSDYCRRLSGEVAVEEEEEEVRKGIRFHVSSGSPPSASLPPSLLHLFLPPGSLETEWLSREGKHAALPPPLSSPPPPPPSIRPTSSLQINKGSKREESNTEGRFFTSSTLHMFSTQQFFPPGFDLEGDQDQDLVQEVQLHVSGCSECGHPAAVVL